MIQNTRNLNPFRVVFLYLSFSVGDHPQLLTKPGGCPIIPLCSFVLTFVTFVVKFKVLNHNGPQSISQKDAKKKTLKTDFLDILMNKQVAEPRSGSI